MIVRMTPTSTLAEQDLLARTFRSHEGVAFMNGWVESRRADGFPTIGSDALERARFESDGLVEASTYFVSDDMVQVATYAARRMPNQAIIESDAPSPHGFLVFETPIVIRDVRGRDCTVAAYRWSKRQARTADGKDTFGFFWTVYSDVTDDRDEYAATARKNDRVRRAWTPRFMILAEDFEGFGMGELDAREISERYDERGVPHKMVDIEEGLFYMRRLPQALWSLMGQRIANVSSERAARAERRRMERSGMLSDRPIRVVRLRRESSVVTDAGQTTVDWAHRWIVEGHWRNQWLPSKSAHRLQWIAPYVKGPEDKPLVVKPTVNALVR